MNAPVEVWATNADFADALAVVLSGTVYPFTQEHKEEKASVEMSYDGTLCDVHPQLMRSIELRAIDANKTETMVLKLVEKVQAELMVDQADTLLLFRRDFLLVRLNNSKTPNSGRSIYVDVSSVRSAIQSKISAGEKQRKKVVWWTVGMVATAAYLCM